MHHRSDISILRRPESVPSPARSPRLSPRLSFDRALPRPAPATILVRILLALLAGSWLTAAAQPQQIALLLRAAEPRAAEPNGPAGPPARAGLGESASADPWDHLDWSVRGTVHLPYDAPVQLSLDADLSYDLAGPGFAARRRAERELHRDLVVLREARSTRQRQIAILDAYCTIVFLHGVDRLLEHRIALADGAEERAVWRARRDVAGHDASVAGAALERLVPGATSVPGRDRLVCSLEHAFDFDRLLAPERDPAAHPEVLEGALGWLRERLYDEFAAEPGSASLFVQTSLDLAFDGDVAASYRLRVGARVPLDLPGSGVGAQLTAEVGLDDIGIGFGARSDRFGAEAPAAGDDRTLDAVVAESRRRIGQELDASRFALALDVARERAAWNRLDRSRPALAPASCPAVCPLDLASISDPRVLDLLLEAVAESHRTQLSRLRLLDRLALLPSDALGPIRGHGGHDDGIMSPCPASPSSEPASPVSPPPISSAPSCRTPP